MQPRGERTVPSKSVQPAPGADENILHQLQRFLSGPPGKTQAESEHPRRMFLVEQLESARVPAPSAPKDIARVRLFHAASCQWSCHSPDLMTPPGATGCKPTCGAPASSCTRTTRRPVSVTPERARRAMQGTW